MNEPAQQNIEGGEATRRTPELRKGLPPLPPRLRHRPLDDRGYPVPWFVAYIDGKPDFRVADRAKFALALKNGLCWLCGQQLGVHKTFVIGPMCAVNRITSEPPSHLECAHFAAKACPFLTLPNAKYRENNLPDGVKDPGGCLSKRNPGVALLWTTRKFVTFSVPNGVLLQLGDPESLEWFAEGRTATRAECLASIEGGGAFLEKLAREDGDTALQHFKQMYDAALTLLPAEEEGAATSSPATKEASP